MAEVSVAEDQGCIANCSEWAVVSPKRLYFRASSLGSTQFLLTWDFPQSSLWPGFQLQPKRAQETEEKNTPKMEVRVFL